MPPSRTSARTRSACRPARPRDRSCPSTCALCKRDPRARARAVRAHGVDAAATAAAALEGDEAAVGGDVWIVVAGLAGRPCQLTFAGPVARRHEDRSLGPVRAEIAAEGDVPIGAGWRRTAAGAVDPSANAGNANTTSNNRFMAILLRTDEDADDASGGRVGGETRESTVFPWDGLWLATGLSPASGIC